MIPNSKASSREGDAVDVLNQLRKEEEERNQTKVDTAKQGFLNTSVAEDLRIINLGRGFHSLETNPKEAVKFLTESQTSKAPDDPLRIVIQYYLGQAYLKSGQIAQAAKIAEDLVLEKNVQDSFEKLALTLAIEANFELKDFKKVIELFGSYTKKFSFSRKQEALAQLTIQALEKKGEFEKSLDLAEELARGYPTTPESRWAFYHLLDLSCKDGQKQKKPAYYFSRRFLLYLAKNAIIHNGISEFITNIIDMPIRHNDLKVRVMTEDEKADFLYRARFYREALAKTRELYDIEKHKPQGSLMGSYLFDLGRIHLRMFEPMMATMYFSKFIADYPKSGSLPLVYENMADALRYSNAPKESGEFYRRSLEKKENSLIRWQNFWSLYRSKQYPQALDLLERYGKSLFRQGDDAVTAEYWHGRILENLGKHAEAASIYRRILDESGESFYANLVVTRKPQLIRSTPGTLQVEGTSRSPGGMALAAKLMSGQLTEPLDLDATKDLGPNYKMIADLLKAGLKDVASVQLNSLNWGKINHEEAFAAVSRLSYYLRDYLPSRKIRYIGFSPLRSIPDRWEDFVSHQSRYNNDWKVYYPYAYHQYVAPISQKIKVSPFLVLSVMRAESFYRREARSGVGAEGLMQLMPYTAMKIATLIGDQDFNILHLDRPEVNISYGAYYLDRLLRYYGGNPFLAVAAYNGGPHAVNHWLDSCKGCSVDEFVESISYRETRRYVREVMKNYINYKRIYTDEKYLVKLPEMPSQLPDGEEIF